MPDLSGYWRGDDVLHKRGDNLPRLSQKRAGPGHGLHRIDGGHRQHPGANSGRVHRGPLGLELHLSDQRAHRHSPAPPLHQIPENRGDEIQEPGGGLDRGLDPDRTHRLHDDISRPALLWLCPDAAHNPLSTDLRPILLRIHNQRVQAEVAPAGPFHLPLPDVCPAQHQPDPLLRGQPDDNRPRAVLF